MTIDEARSLPAGTAVLWYARDARGMHHDLKADLVRTTAKRVVLKGVGGWDATVNPKHVRVDRESRTR